MLVLSACAGGADAGSGEDFADDATELGSAQEALTITPPFLPSTSVAPVTVPELPLSEPPVADTPVPVEPPRCASECVRDMSGACGSWQSVTCQCPQGTTEQCFAAKGQSCDACGLAAIPEEQPSVRVQGGASSICMTSCLGRIKAQVEQGLGIQSLAAALFCLIECPPITGDSAPIGGSGEPIVHCDECLDPSAYAVGMVNGKLQVYAPLGMTVTSITLATPAADVAPAQLSTLLRPTLRSQGLHTSVTALPSAFARSAVVEGTFNGEVYRVTVPISAGPPVLPRP